MQFERLVPELSKYFAFLFKDHFTHTNSFLHSPEDVAARLIGSTVTGLGTPGSSVTIA